jgi:hypothetical protein
MTPRHHASQGCSEGSSQAFGTALRSRVEAHQVPPSPEGLANTSISRGQGMLLSFARTSCSSVA